ncbi:cytochrome c-type biogenesis protein CcmH [Seohaeicola saemankumensis]|nr:cytochrome c-type biogenesis protein [Seohaeicola saemankumensis]MCA0871402.1 cytochrome c-type biogenesis protein CcmH [Seohaeicola saemankumensis]
MLRAMTFLIAMTLAGMAAAVEPDEMLSDPVLEARARDISKELRCVVCLNQNIDSSNAGVARDLRLLVRERLVAGDTNEQALAFIQARYGDYVLLNPPWNAKTYVLWVAPLAMVIAALGIGFATVRQRRAGGRSAGHSAVEKNQLSTDEELEVANFIEHYNSGDRS